MSKHFPSGSCQSAGLIPLLSLYSLLFIYLFRFMTDSILISQVEMGEVNGEDVKLVLDEMESESKSKRAVKGLEMF